MTSLTFPASPTPQDAWRFVRRGAERALSVARGRRLTAPQLTVVLVAVLALGIGVSILTTTDPFWYRLHFSELGTFHDFSGDVFNATLVLAGVVIVVFALRTHSDLAVLARAGHRRPRLLVALMVAGGVQLAVVGLVPVDTLTFVHDRAASGVMMCFAGVLVSVGREWRVLPRALRSATAVVTLALGAATPVFLAGGINLAAFEAIGFSLIFAWLGVFTTTLHTNAQRTLARHAAAERAAAQLTPVVALPATATPAPAAAAPALPAPAVPARLAVAA